MKRRRTPYLVQKLITVSAGFAGLLAIGLVSQAPSLPIPFVGAGCSIKGNISMNTGERIYHVPGQEHYTETMISLGKGERWFCSEAEAKAAGWRRARG